VAYLTPEILGETVELKTAVHVLADCEAFADFAEDLGLVERIKAIVKEEL
jgi:hypothetical protein